MNSRKNLAAIFIPHQQKTTAKAVAKKSNLIMALCYKFGLFSVSLCGILNK